MCQSRPPAGDRKPQRCSQACSTAPLPAPGWMGGTRGARGERGKLLGARLGSERVAWHGGFHQHGGFPGAVAFLTSPGAGKPQPVVVYPVKSAAVRSRLQHGSFSPSPVCRRAVVCQGMRNPAGTPRGRAGRMGGPSASSHRGERRKGVGMEGGCSEKPPHASPHDVGLSSLGMSPPRPCLSRSTFLSFPLLIPLGNQLFPAFSFGLGWGEARAASGRGDMRMGMGQPLACWSSAVPAPSGRIPTPFC